MVCTKKNCQVECKKGANHIIRNKDRVHNFKPCDPDTARSKIANAFPGESDLPQPWVHPTFSKAYHCGETVLLVPPVCIPSSDTDTVTICPTSSNREGITTCWLKHKSPDARRDYAERKKDRGCSFGYTTGASSGEALSWFHLWFNCACVLWMFRVSIQSESGLFGVRIQERHSCIERHN